MFERGAETGTTSGEDACSDLGSILLSEAGRFWGMVFISDGRLKNKSLWEDFKIEIP